ncbi:hypothetical protein MMA231_03115 [Asticcacaulis sp. MM231]|uniref:hypothetical protein n=1 Tax=Asticcacaulis sp. MM231 TaxID=3157666 RepID=UPI0032D57BB8
MSYLASEACQQQWYHLRVRGTDTGQAAQRFRAAHDDQQRMNGSAYYIEFIGEFHQYAKNERRLYKGYVGYFDVIDLRSFTELGHSAGLQVN